MLLNPRDCVLCGQQGAVLTPEQSMHQGVAAALAGVAEHQRVLCVTCLAGEVPSPCVSLCTLDAEGVTCRGCGRTMREITAWRGMLPQERAEVLLRLRASH